MKEQIILGLGNNIDYEIEWDSGVFENMITRYDIHDQELSTAVDVTSERNLVISILGFLKSENGGERFVSSPEIIEQFAGNFKKRITLGGTSVRAAIAMRKLGFTSALHLVTINDDVRRLIPKDSPYVCSNTRESSYPHLIIQFCKAVKVKAGDINICTSRENRIIYNNDYDNIVMELNEDFADLITDAKVFLISGFNAMQSRELLDQRLRTLLKIMEKIPRDALVFYEDACFYNAGFSKHVHAALVSHINIYSLNEDELQHYIGRRIDLLDASQIKAALEDFHKLVPVPLIVVHSLYWALAYGDNAKTLTAALIGGTAMATTRFRFGDDFTVENYRETVNLAPNEKGAVFAGAIEALLGSKICCIPVVRVPETKVTTIGLGDSFVGGFLPALLN